MKTLVNALATAVRKSPWIVIVVVIVMSMVLGNFASKFLPAEDQNESFAPDAPELTAASEISEAFGAISRMQVVVSSVSGDVITLEALEAFVALEESVRGSEAAEFLVDQPQNPAVLSHLAPVYFAIGAGEPFPTSDADVKSLYKIGLDLTPPEARGFITALLSDDADLDAATAEIALDVISYQSSDDFDELAQRALAMADAVTGAPTGSTITQEPFNVELIFSDTDEFQTEISRLLVAAAMIILLVLAFIFMVAPSGSREKAVFAGGLVLMFVGAGIAVAPGLAKIFPDLLPTSWAEAELLPVILSALAFYTVAFLMWSLTSKRLRRTTADTLVTFLTIALAIQWMSGYGYLRFGDQSQMVQILPILLIGLGVDYSIHMTTRYRQELTAGRSVDAAVATAIRTVGVALVLATLTTAVGFLTNMTSSIPALAEFGELAAVGIAASFVLMLTFVPAVRELLDRKAERSGTLDTASLEAGNSRTLPRIIGSFAVLPRRFAVATVIVSLALAAVGAFGTTKLSTEFSFLDFVPTTSPLRDTAVTVDERFDFPETTSVLITGDLATGEGWNAMLASYGGAAGVEDVSVIELESGARFPIGQSLMFVMFQWLNPGSPQFDQDLFNEAVAVGFNQDRTVPANADVSPLYAAAFAKDPITMSSVLAPDYGSAVYNFDTTSGEQGAALISTNLNAAFAPMVAIGGTAVATSTFIINGLVVDTLSASQVSSLLLTLGAALLLLVANFWFESRRPMLGVITTLPVAIVVVWTFGIMAALNIPFGPVTATISALSIGIGIPYMIHVTHRYLEEGAVFADENEAIEHTLIHTGGALAGSAITTVLGFGILVTSTTIPFRQFGFVTAYTILLALIAAVLVLPSMLVLWSRWHAKRGHATASIGPVGGDLTDGPAGA
ncbi:MAG: MMPL family transporter [Actinomycetota bacterium]|nr:MMPL family transporter [Actinomycetota bacterium]